MFRAIARYDYSVTVQHPDEHPLLTTGICWEEEREPTEQEKARGLVNQFFLQLMKPFVSEEHLKYLEDRIVDDAVVSHLQHWTYYFSEPRLCWHLSRSGRERLFILSWVAG